MLDQALRARVLASTRAARPVGRGPARRRRSVAARSARSRRRAARAPGEKLFLASLAIACLAPLQPLPPECDATDRLADWATRDADNGVPSLLLADRARQRNNAASMVAFLEEAATRPRFDDYQNRGALLVWDAVRAVPGQRRSGRPRGARRGYGAGRVLYAVRGRCKLLCRDAAQLADNIRAACASAGTAAAQRAATWSLRIGRRAARGTQRNRRRTGGAPQQLIDVQRRAYECAEAGNADRAGARVAPTPPCGPRAVAQWEARLAREARVGEVAACETQGLGRLHRRRRDACNRRCASARPAASASGTARPAPCRRAARGAAAGRPRRRSPRLRETACGARRAARA